VSVWAARLAGMPGRFFVVQMTTVFTSMEEARSKAPELMERHIAGTREAHRRGEVVMAGAFLTPPAEGELVETMAVLNSAAAAQAFVDGDPFVQAGLVRDWTIREWADMLE
jgi:uncharacterized protein YciI